MVGCDCQLVTVGHQLNIKMKVFMKKKNFSIIVICQGTCERYFEFGKKITQSG